MLLLTWYLLSHVRQIWVISRSWVRVPTRQTRNKSKMKANLTSLQLMNDPRQNDVKPHRLVTIGKSDSLCFGGCPLFSIIQGRAQSGEDDSLIICNDRFTSGGDSIETGANGPPFPSNMTPLQQMLCLSDTLNKTAKFAGLGDCLAVSQRIYKVT